MMRFLGRNVIFIITVVLLRSMIGFAEEQPAQRSFPPDGAVSLEALPSPPNKRSTPSTLGIGVSILPIQETWGFAEGKSLFQGGMQIDGFWQRDSWYRLGLSIGGTGHTMLADLGFYYGELTILAEARFFVPKLMKTFRRVGLLAYFVAAFPISIAYSSISNGDTQKISRNEDYLGLQLGMGLELRLSPRVALTFDARGLFRAGVAPADSNYLQGGFRVGIGFVYCFQGALK